MDSIDAHPLIRQLQPIFAELRSCSAEALPSVILKLEYVIEEERDVLQYRNVAREPPSLSSPSMLFAPHTSAAMTTTMTSTALSARALPNWLSAQMRELFAHPRTHLAGVHASRVLLRVAYVDLNEMTRTYSDLLARCVFETTDYHTGLLAASVWGTLLNNGSSVAETIVDSCLRFCIALLLLLQQRRSTRSSAVMASSGSSSSSSFHDGNDSSRVVYHRYIATLAQTPSQQQQQQQQQQHSDSVSASTLHGRDDKQQQQQGSAFSEHYLRDSAAVYPRATRLSACTFLQQLVRRVPSAVVPHMDAILAGLRYAVVDEDALVRATSVEVLQQTLHIAYRSVAVAVCQGWQEAFLGDVVRALHFGSDVVLHGCLLTLKALLASLVTAREGDGRVVALSMTATRAVQQAWSYVHTQLAPHKHDGDAGGGSSSSSRSTAATTRMMYEEGMLRFAVRCEVLHVLPLFARYDAVTFRRTTMPRLLELASDTFTRTTGPDERAMLFVVLSGVLTALPDLLPHVMERVMYYIALSLTPRPRRPRCDEAVTCFATLCTLTPSTVRPFLRHLLGPLFAGDVTESFACNVAKVCAAFPELRSVCLSRVLESAKQRLLTARYAQQQQQHGGHVTRAVHATPASRYAVYTTTTTSTSAATTTGAVGGAAAAAAAVSLASATAAPRSVASAPSLYEYGGGSSSSCGNLQDNHYVYRYYYHDSNDYGCVSASDGGAEYVGDTHASTLLLSSHHRYRQEQQQQQQQLPSSSPCRDVLTCLHALASLDFAGYSTLQFLHDAVLCYVADAHEEVRRAAIDLCFRLVFSGCTQSPCVRSEAGVVVHHGRDHVRLVNAVVRQLVHVAVADSESDIRLHTLERFTRAFDATLALQDMVALLSPALYDKHPNRLVAIRVLGRLAQHNPACVHPALRTVMLHAVADVQHFGFAKVQERALWVLSALIEAAPAMMLPYVPALLRECVARLKRCSSGGGGGGSGTARGEDDGRGTMTPSHSSSASLSAALHRNASDNASDSNNNNMNDADDGSGRHLDRDGGQQQLYHMHPSPSLDEYHIACDVPVLCALLCCLGKLARYVDSNNTDDVAVVAEVRPFVVAHILDASNAAKKQEAMRALGDIIRTTKDVGVYEAHPELLRVLLSALYGTYKETSQMRLDVLRLMGIIGAVDPVRVKDMMRRLRDADVEAAARRGQDVDGGGGGGGGPAHHDGVPPLRVAAVLTTTAAQHHRHRRRGNDKGHDGGDNNNNNTLAARGECELAQDVMQQLLVVLQQQQLPLLTDEQCVVATRVVVHLLAMHDEDVSACWPRYYGSIAAVVLQHARGRSKIRERLLHLLTEVVVLMGAHVRQHVELLLPAVLSFASAHEDAGVLLAVLRLVVHLRRTLREEFRAWLPTLLRVLVRCVQADVAHAYEAVFALFVVLGSLLDGHVHVVLPCVCERANCASAPLSQRVAAVRVMCHFARRLPHLSYHAARCIHCLCDVLKETAVGAHAHVSSSPWPTLPASTGAGAGAGLQPQQPTALEAVSGHTLAAAALEALCDVARNLGSDFAKYNYLVTTALELHGRAGADARACIAAAMRTCGWQSSVASYSGSGNGGDDVVAAAAAAAATNAVASSSSSAMTAMATAAAATRAEDDAAAFFAASGAEERQQLQLLLTLSEQQQSQRHPHLGSNSNNSSHDDDNNNDVVDAARAMPAATHARADAVSQLRGVLDVRERETEEDWNVWLKQLSLELLRLSPSPSHNVAYALAYIDEMFARYMLHSAFAMCYDEMDRGAKATVAALLGAVLRTSHAPVSVLHELLNLAEYMERLYMHFDPNSHYRHRHSPRRHRRRQQQQQMRPHEKEEEASDNDDDNDAGDDDDEDANSDDDDSSSSSDRDDRDGDGGGLLFDLPTLMESSERCNSFAKALHYVELAFHRLTRAYERGVARGRPRPLPPHKWRRLVQLCEKSIYLCNLLGQRESAEGVLTYIQQNFALLTGKPASEMLRMMDAQLFEKLQWWSQSLRAYQQSLLTSPNEFASMAGLVRSLDNLGDYGQLLAMWKRLAPRVSRRELGELAPYGAHAAWLLRCWDDMERITAAMPHDGYIGTTAVFYRAVTAVHKGQFYEAEALIAQCRKRLDTTLSTLVVESYDRAYHILVGIQQLSELEELAFVVKNPHGLRHWQELWERRLGAMAFDGWPGTLANHTLIIPPTQELNMWLRFVALSRLHARERTSLEVLYELLGSQDIASALQQAVLPQPAIALAAFQHLYDTQQREQAIALLDDYVAKMERSGRVAALAPTDTANFAVCHTRLADWLFVQRRKQQRAGGGGGSHNDHHHHHHHHGRHRYDGDDRPPRPRRATIGAAVGNDARVKETAVDGGASSSSRAQSIDEVLAHLHRATALDARNGAIWHTLARLYHGLVPMANSSAEASVVAAQPVYAERIVWAMSGYLRSICLSQELEDVLGFLSLWFAYGSLLLMHQQQPSPLQRQPPPLHQQRQYSPSSPPSLQQLRSNALWAEMLRVSPTVWLKVIPQIIARMHTRDTHMAESVFDLLVNVAEAHPQALLYSLNVTNNTTTTSTAATAASPMATSTAEAAAAAANARVTVNEQLDRQRAAQRILDKIVAMHPSGATLVVEAALVCRELVRCAVLWSEVWFDELERAWYQWGRDHNAHNMLTLLQPLLQQMSSPETMAESHFVAEFGELLYGACESVAKAATLANAVYMDEAWSRFKTAVKCMDEQISNMTSLELQLVSPRLVQHGKHLSLVVPGQYHESGLFPRIASFRGVLKVMNSKQHPRQLYINGSDGVLYKFLLKGHEDLRLDERVMQLLAFVNTLLAKHAAIQRRDGMIQTYSVTPLSDNAGLVGWVDHCDTLHQLIKEYRVHTRYLGVEIGLMRGFGADLDRLTPIQHVEPFEYALAHTDGDDLANSLWLHAYNAESWLDHRTTYVCSLATMSMVGHILGLGDRHPSNLMIHAFSGRVVHIDFGDCFEVAMTRASFPEKVPFRLTRMLVKAMEMGGIEGLFRHGCMAVMSVLREEGSSILALLEAFVHDPLVSWWRNDDDDGDDDNVHTKDDSVVDEDTTNNVNGTDNTVSDTVARASTGARGAVAGGDGGTAAAAAGECAKAVAATTTRRRHGDAYVAIAASFRKQHTAAGGVVACSVEPAHRHHSRHTRPRDGHSVSCRDRTTTSTYTPRMGGVHGAARHLSHAPHGSSSGAGATSDNNSSSHSSVASTSEHAWERQASKAHRVVRRIKEKLDGREWRRRGGSGGGGGGGGGAAADDGLSVEAQVAQLIRQATNNENLCVHFQGWCPFW